MTTSRFAIRRCFAKYTELLAEKPLRTKIATGGFLCTSADILSQTFEPDSPYDYRRSLSMAVFGTLYAGAFQHYLFGFYSRAWPVLRATARSKRIVAAVKTTAVQQLITTPFVYFPSFIGVTSLVRASESRLTHKPPF